MMAPDRPEGPDEAPGLGEQLRRRDRTAPEDLQHRVQPGGIPIQHPVAQEPPPGEETGDRIDQDSVEEQRTGTEAPFPDEGEEHAGGEEPEGQAAEFAQGGQPQQEPEEDRAGPRHPVSPQAGQRPQGEGGHGVDQRVVVDRAHHKGKHRIPCGQRSRPQGPARAAGSHRPDRGVDRPHGDQPKKQGEKAPPMQGAHRPRPGEPLPGAVQGHVLVVRQFRVPRGRMPVLYAHGLQVLQGPAEKAGESRQHRVIERRLAALLSPGRLLAGPLHRQSPASRQVGRHPHMPQLIGRLKQRRRKLKEPPDERKGKQEQMDRPHRPLRSGSTSSPTSGRCWTPAHGPAKMKARRS
jgi:hypothetical protein